jgi:LacI family transcriptional regulator
MSVAGFDDYRVISETLYPQLTTMELPYARMGEAAARLMLNELRGGDTVLQGTRVLVQGDLRWRASVVPGPALST